MSVQVQRDTKALTDRLRLRMKNQGYPFDTYDPDFLLGVFMEWLGENDAVLTAAGVRRFRR